MRFTKKIDHGAPVRKAPRPPNYLEKPFLLTLFYRIDEFDFLQTNKRMEKDGSG
jgi:hypothetical protein